MLLGQVKYDAPEIGVYYFVPEGVLCQSNSDSGLDMDPDEGNM